MLIFTAALCFAFAGIFLVAGRLLVNRYRHRRQAKAWSCRPAPYCPSGLFGIKAFLDLQRAQRKGRIVYRVRELHEKYGNTFELKVVGNPAVFTVEPENIKAVLATQFNDFGLGLRPKSFGPVLGDGIFTLDGTGWWHSRTLLRPQFTRDQVCSSFSRLLVEQVVLCMYCMYMTSNR